MATPNDCNNMEKILDYDFSEELSECLKEAGLKDKEINSLISKRQFDVIKAEVLSKLEKISDLIKKDKFDELLTLTEYSPAGDGYGKDNHYISFEEETGYEDIYDICDALKSLKNNIKK